MVGVVGVIGGGGGGGGGDGGDNDDVGIFKFCVTVSCGFLLE